VDQRDAYLARVGLSRFPAASEEGLRELHAAQAFAIPFENVNPLLGEPVKLELDALFAKLVAQKRGGYCFELNGLFHWAMSQAGFTPVAHLARLAKRIPGWSRK
jgi:N-hydroxyarylamine O-acetyltransferase